MLMGIDVERESDVSRILSSIEERQVPRPGRDEIVLGREMARQLAVGMGDEVVIVVPAADGSMGNDLFRVAGIYRSGMTELDNAYGLVPIDALQTLDVPEPGRIHEVDARTSEPGEPPKPRIALPRRSRKSKSCLGRCSDPRCSTSGRWWCSRRHGRSTGLAPLRTSR